MNLVDLEVKDFIEEVGSSSPAPGGGSVSALVASMGVALSNMVGKLSLNKKKFKALETAVQEMFVETMEALETLRYSLVEYVDKDTKAFNEIMTAFKLPKESDQEKKIRGDAIQTATLSATKVPMEVCRIAMTSIEKIEKIIAFINKNTMSDIGVSILMIQAGLEGAAMNVLINTSGLKDEELKAKYNSEVQTLINDSRVLKERVIELVYSKL